MQVIEYPSSAEFLDVARTMLEANEAADELILSYATNQTKGVENTMSTKFFTVLDDDDEVALSAMFTPDIWPGITEGPEEAARIFARYLFPKNPRPNGVTGPKDTTLAFADEWERLTHCNLEIGMNLRLYECTSLTDIKLAEGTSRQATMDDFEIVKKWRYAFKDELEVPITTNDEIIARQLSGDGYYLWETDQPVSIALYGRETENGASVGAVYTPPELRRKGYATAITAAVTQAILDSGKKYATLYTDLDNPTSNSIYMQIGYTPIRDSTLWRFLPAI